MNEYISREETVKAFCEKCKGYYDGHCIHRGECDIDVITTAPAADVQPVVHAKWLCLEPEIGLYYSCSRCGHNTFQGMYKFCPNCGARMDGDSE